MPVIFAYGGWQTATFVAGEIKEPRKNLPRGLILGVTGVVLLYLAANVVYISVLGTSGLAASTAPASEVMRRALGDFGAARNRGWNRDLDRGLLESKHAHGAKSLLRDGKRRTVLQAASAPFIHERARRSLRLLFRDCWQS